MNLKIILLITQAILIIAMIFLHFDHQNRLIKEAEYNFDKGIKKSFVLGWLKGSKNMQDFSNYDVPKDTFFIMLAKDSTEFNNLMNKIK